MSNLPIGTYQIGGLKLTIWAGDKENNYQLTRSYKTKDGEWKQSNYLSIQDLIVGKHLFEQAIENSSCLKEAYSKSDAPIKKEADLSYIDNPFA